MEDTIVSSGADLSATFTADDMNTDASAVGMDPVSPDAEGTSDVDLAALNDQGDGLDAVEDPSPDNIINEDAAEAEPEVADQAQEDALPDGVRKGKDRSGKDGMWLTPPRYEQFHGAHKMMREFEAIAGEPVTAQVFDVYSRVFLEHEKLYSDMLSGDPTAQGAVLQYFIQEGARARQAGEIGADPIIPLAKTFYTSVQNDHPEAYAALRMQAATDLVTELYAEAGGKGSADLWNSVGHIAMALGLPYRKSAEMEAFARTAADPVTALQKRNQELEAMLNGRSTNDQTAQFDSWHNDHKQKVSSSILNEAVLPALSETQKAWEKLPGGKEAFQDLIVNRLHSKVRETLKADQRFGERITLLSKNARRATSAQARAAIGEQIKQAYINRANLAAAAHRPEIERFAGLAFKEQNAASHQRRATAAQRVAPGGGGLPANKSLVPASHDYEMGTPGNLLASMKGLF